MSPQYPPKKDNRRTTREGVPGLRPLLLETLDLQPNWLENLEHNPLRTIIRKATFGVLSHLVRNVYQVPPTEKVFLDLEKAVGGQFDLKKLKKTAGKTEKQPDVLNEEQTQGLQFLAQLVKLNKIADLGGTKYFPWIQEEIVRLMHYQNDDGRFPLLYHHHAHALWVLIRLGLEGNRILDRGYHWISERQREDGGWLHRSMKPANRSYDQTKSCFWTTAEIVQALSVRKSYRHLDVTKQGCEFLLENLLKTNSTSFLSDIDAFNHLQIGNSGDSMFYGGSLKVLEACLNAGYKNDDPRIRKLLKWIAEVQMDDGLFPRIVNRIPVGDQFVTVRILKIYKLLHAAR